MEVILIRHGQSQSNARLTDALDAKLTDLGERQALATAKYLLSSRILADLSKVVVFVSPFHRTLQTCKPFTELTGISAHAYPDMCEYFSRDTEAYREFVGLSDEEIRRQFPKVEIDTIFQCQGAWWPSSPEDVNSIYQRAERVRNTLIERYFTTNNKIIIYSHAEPIGRLVEAMQRVPPSLGWPPWSENCGITRLLVGRTDEPAELVVLNDTSHLRDLGLVSPTFPGFNSPPEPAAPPA